MGADDDTDCVEHLWGLSELVLTMNGAEMISTCLRCEAISYEGSRAQRDRGKGLRG